MKYGPNEQTYRETDGLSSDGKELPPPMDTRKIRGITTALPAFGG